MAKSKNKRKGSGRLSTASTKAPSTQESLAGEPMEEQLAEEPLEEQLAEEPTEEPEFNGLSLRDFPVEAHPDMTKKHAGKFSYTVYLTAGGETGTIDVLLMADEPRCPLASSVGL